MQEILKVRFLNRDKVLRKILTSIAGEMNARGMFHSGETVKRTHAALEEELVEARRIIITTISENLRISKPYKIDKKLREKAVVWLRDRKEYLENSYLTGNRILTGLQNKKMLEPCLNLSESLELNEQELRVGLSQEIENYLHSQGATLYERVKSRFLNYPLIVIGVITVVVVIAILSFLSKLGLLKIGS